MSEWAAALIGVGGTLAGAALGGTFAYVTERSRWVREQSSRWTDERRRLYAQVIAECEYIVHNALGNLHDRERLTIGDYLGEIRPVREHLRPLIADLELIGTEDDAEAARSLTRAAERLLDKAVRNPDAPAMPAWQEWGAALDAFKRQARAGLHLGGGSVSFRRRLATARVAGRDVGPA